MKTYYQYVKDNSTITDRKLPELESGLLTNYQSDITQESRYYPFGMLMDLGDSLGYRFGFQGQEAESEIAGVEGVYSFFKYRISDNRLGRFFAVNPLSPDYPWNSPYAFSENTVISHVELEGLEKESAFTRMYNLDGRNKNMPIGLIKHEAYNPARGKSGLPIVNSTGQALKHYFKGGGETVELGTDVQDILRNSGRVNRARENLREGRTTLPAQGDGDLPVDVTFQGAFFVCRIGLSYKTICDDDNCTTTFTLNDRGFVDANIFIAWLTADNEGANAELPKGRVYDFEPYIFEETYPNPGYPLDENGTPSAIPQNEDSQQEDSK